MFKRVFWQITGQRDAKPMESRITFYATANESSILLIFTMLQLQNIQERQPFYDLVSVQQKIEQIRTSRLFIRLSTFTLT